MREAKYPIDGSGVVYRETFHSAADVVRNGGTVNGGSFQNGVYVANGTSDYIDTKQTFNGIFRKSFSIELLIRPADGRPSSSETFLGMADASLTNRLMVHLLITGKIQVAYESNNNLVFVSSTTNLNDGQQDWIHIVAVSDSTISGAGGLKLYINGELDGTGDTSAVVFSDFYDALNPFIGAINNNGSPNNFFQGDIDYINIYNRPLTASEASNLYSNKQYAGLVTDGLVMYHDYTKQTAFDWSHSGNNGVLTPGNGGFLKQGVLFDGDTTKVEVGNIAQTLKTIGIVVELDSTTEELIDLDGTNKMGVTAGTLSCGGFASEYIDGVLTNTGVTAKKDFYLVVTDTTGVLADDFDIGENSLGGIVKAIHVNTDQLTIKQIEQNKQYFKTMGML